MGLLVVQAQASKAQADVAKGRLERGLTEYANQIADVLDGNTKMTGVHMAKLIGLLMLKDSGSTIVGQLSGLARGNILGKGSKIPGKTMPKTVQRNQSRRTTEKATRGL